jgi:Flp pilus assembly protein TadB
VIAALVLGAGVGLGLLLMLSGLASVRPPLALASARLHRPANLGSSTPAQAPTLLRRTVGWLAKTLGLNGLVEDSVEDSVEADLRVIGQSLDDHVTSRVTIAILAAALPPATAGIMVAGGVPVPFGVPAFATLLLAVAGYFVPLLTLRSQATERRRSFRHALSSFLDLVAVTLAGGAGIETALHRSAETGQGWAFEEVRQALLTSRLLGETPWTGLDRLGQELGIVELQELAASVALAGEDGARVRVSIAAKARAVRTRVLTDTEAGAQAATERMSLPIVLLMVGFMIFVIYPAIARIITGV